MGGVASFVVLLVDGAEASKRFNVVQESVC